MKVCESPRLTSSVMLRRLVELGQQAVELLDGTKLGLGALADDGAG